MSYLERIEKALENHGPVHALAVKLKISPDTIFRIKKGTEPSQRAVINRIETGLKKLENKPKGEENNVG